MDDLSKKLGYLNGLLAAKEQDEVTSAIADLLNALTDAVNAHDVLLEDLNDYVESIDDDLSALESGNPDAFEPDDDYDAAPFHVVNGGAKPDTSADAQNDDDTCDEDPEGDDIPTVVGCVCTKCSALFLISAEDRPGLEYICPQCRQRIVPGPLTPETIKPVAPIE